MVRGSLMARRRVFQIVRRRRSQSSSLLGRSLRRASLSTLRSLSRRWLQPSSLVEPHPRRAAPPSIGQMSWAF